MASFGPLCQIPDFRRVSYYCFYFGHVSGFGPLSFTIINIIIIIMCVGVFVCAAVAPVFTSLQAMLMSAEVSLSVGDSVGLRCDAVGRPRVQVQWFKDDKMLSASGPASTSSSSLPSVDYYNYDYPLTGGGDGTPSSSRRVRHPYTHRQRGRRSAGSAGDLLLDNVDQLYAGDDDERLSLKLDSVTSDDAGFYTCRAFNKAGTVNFTYTVHVTGMRQLTTSLVVLGTGTGTCEKVLVATTKSFSAVIDTLWHLYSDTLSVWTTGFNV